MSEVSSTHPSNDRRLLAIADAWRRQGAEGRITVSTADDVEPFEIGFRSLFGVKQEGTQ